MAKIIRVSPSEAAKLFGVNQRSIRRAIASGELRYIVNKGRYRINFEDVIRWSERLPSRIQKRDEYGIGQYIEKWRMPRPNLNE